LPFQRTAAGGIERRIVVEYNEAVELYNTKLSKGLASFNHNTTTQTAGLFTLMSTTLSLISF
jgi:hypothetical protein